MPHVLGLRQEAGTPEARGGIDSTLPPSRAQLGYTRSQVARILLRNALLLDPEGPAPQPASLLLEDGRIAARLGADAIGAGDAVVIDLDGLHVAPGFLDLHWHGALVFGPPEGITAALPLAIGSAPRPLCQRAGSP